MEGKGREVTGGERRGGEGKGGMGCGATGRQVPRAPHWKKTGLLMGGYDYDARPSGSKFLSIILPVAST